MIWKNQRGTKKRLAHLQHDRFGDRVVRQTNANRFILGVLESLRSFLGRLKNEGEGAWSHRFDESEGFVIDLSKGGYFRNISTNQGEIVIFTQSPNPSDPLKTLLVIHSASKRVGRVRGIDDDPALQENFRGSLDEPTLGVLGMYLEIL